MLSTSAPLKRISKNARTMPHCLPNSKRICSKPTGALQTSHTNYTNKKMRINVLSNRYNPSWMLLTVCLMLLCWSYPSLAQQPELVKQLEDHSWVVQIGDEPFRCLDATAMRDVVKTRIERDAYRDQVASLTGQVKTLNELLAEKDRVITLKSGELTIERSLSASKDKQLAEASALLEQARKVTRRGKVGKLFDHPVSQVMFHIVLPAAVASWRTKDATAK